MAASDKGAAKGAQSKRAFRDVVSTPGRRSESPLKKQPKQAVEEGAIGSSKGSNAFNTQMMMAAINAALDTKLDQLAARIENMVTLKIEELERKFENVEDEVKKLKDDVLRFDHPLVLALFWHCEEGILGQLSQLISLPSHRLC